MPPLNTANFSLTGMGGTKRTLGARLADIIDVKDYGAVGNGSADDTEAIQDAIDAAFGPFSDPHELDDRYLNKLLFLPAGTYNITSHLVFNHVVGGGMVGAGSHQTKLVYTGTEDPWPDDVSSLLTCRTVDNSHFEGITFDGGGICGVGFRLMNWTTGGDGTGNLYIDCVFTNVLYDCFLSGFQSDGSLGSEQTFIGCTFSNSVLWGHRLAGDNALNHLFLGCLFKDNNIGISCAVGAQNIALGCRFENNTEVDIDQRYNSMLVEGCYSTSPNFLSMFGVVSGCYHDGPPGGYFWNPNLGGGTTISDLVIRGCHSTNGILGGPSGARAYLRGNTWGAAGYKTAFLSGGGIVVEDI